MNWIFLSPRRLNQGLNLSLVVLATALGKHSKKIYTPLSLFPVTVKLYQTLYYLKEKLIWILNVENASRTVNIFSESFLKLWERKIVKYFEFPINWAIFCALDQHLPSSYYSQDTRYAIRRLAVRSKIWSLSAENPDLHLFPYKYSIQS